MGNIVVLDELTINKIAAGEVIERPASVVKEMVENSIDAGATNINIEIQNGGIQKIRISDNGKGITPDDMQMAFERHATSKIRVADDLDTVTSMGFRGEALASIAAIARVEMISRTIDNEVGMKIVVEAGNVLETEEIACPVGTTITVEKLFFNTPVRYKFLKKDYTESGYIEDIVTRLALVNPNIAIKLINSGKNVIQTSGNGDMKSVIYAIYGKDIAQAILDVNYEYENIKIQGVVGKPEIARSNKTNQIFFVNKRYVKDKTLSAAADQAFKGMLPIGKFGFLVLNIIMEPKKLDVNVHPAKLEVRFEQENTVFKAVMYALKEGLLKGELISNPIKTPEKVEEKIPVAEIAPTRPTTTEKGKTKGFADLLRKSTSNKLEEAQPTQRNFIEEIYHAKRFGVNNEEIEDRENIYPTGKSILNDITKKETTKIAEHTPNAFENIPIIEKQDTVKEEETQFSHQIEKAPEGIELPKCLQKPEATEQTVEIKTVELMDTVETKPEESMNADFEEMYEKTFGDIPASMKKPEIKINDIHYVTEDSKRIAERNKRYEDYKFVGIGFSTYIILEIKDELYIIDQHAAHERIMYEKVKQNFYSEGDKDSQLMLVPDVITLTHKEMSITRENISTFEKAGFTLEEFGDNTIKLTGVPNMCMELNTKNLFLDILDEIDTVARTQRQEIEEKFIATIACKAAVKANMSLTKAEVDELMNELLKLPNPFTCPHGRPTAIKMSKTDIEKKFSRR